MNTSWYVCTLVEGKKDYFAKCLPSIRQYAARLGADLYEWGDEDFSGENPKWKVLAMMQDFIFGNEDYFLYLDADILCSPEAHAPPILEHEGWMMTREDVSSYDWEEWLVKTGQGSPENHKYRNTGVIVADRKGVELFLRADNGVRNNGFLEQHQFNSWMRDAGKQGLELPFLPKDFNALENHFECGGLMHFAGGNKVERMNDYLEDMARMPNWGSMPKGESGEAVWIVYPWRTGGSSWDDWELRLSLRSVAENWKGRLDGVIILGERKPDWVSDDVGFRLAPKYRDALEVASKLDGNVVWMNDDLAFLREVTIEDIRRPRHQGVMGVRRINRYLKSRNAWQRRKGGAARWLRRRGFMAVDYSTHTPYLFDCEKMKWLLNEGPWFGYKTAFETLYYNLFSKSRMPKRDCWRAGRVREIPKDMERYAFWNLTDTAVGSKQKDRLVRGYCRGRFPSACKYEREA